MATSICNHCSKIKNGVPTGICNHCGRFGKTYPQWWESLSSLTKTQLCDTHTEIVGKARRHETLSEQEIENLYLAALKP